MISTSRIFILLRSTIIQIIWSLTGVSSIILVFILVLGAACLTDLLLLPNISYKLKRISWVVAMDKCFYHNTLSINPSITQRIFSYAICHLEWTFFFSYVECSLGMSEADSWVTHFSCFIVSTRFKFVFQLTKFGVVNLLSVRIRLIVLGLSDYSIPRLWIIKVHAILSLARLSKSKHNRNMTFKTNNKT